MKRLGLQDKLADCWIHMCVCVCVCVCVCERDTAIKKKHREIQRKWVFKNRLTRVHVDLQDMMKQHYIVLCRNVSYPAVYLVLQYHIPPLTANSLPPLFRRKISSAINWTHGSKRRNKQFSMRHKFLWQLLDWWIIVHDHLAKARKTLITAIINHLFTQINA
jgi:hypothetical protein